MFNLLKRDELRKQHPDHITIYTSALPKTGVVPLPVQLKQLEYINPHFGEPEKPLSKVTVRQRVDEVYLARYVDGKPTCYKVLSPTLGQKVTACTELPPGLDIAILYNLDPFTVTDIVGETDYLKAHATLKKLFPKSVATIHTFTTPTLPSSLGMMKLMVYSPQMAKYDVLTREMVEKEIADASDAYYNKTGSAYTDAEFDYIVDRLRAAYPEADVPIGAPPGSRKVPLPYFVGSLDKLKTQAEVDAWTKKYTTWVALPKLDGVSAVVAYTAKGWTAYKRGDGSNGTNITEAMKHVRGMPAPDAVMKGQRVKSLCVRGELVSIEDIPNARNVVNGCVSALDIDAAKISDNVAFVPYEIVAGGKSLAWKETYAVLSKAFLTPIVPIGEGTGDILLTDANAWYAKHPHECASDGIVFKSAETQVVPKSGNPAYAIAYKGCLANATHDTTVESIEWTVSKDLRWKPTVILATPVVIGGATIGRCTGKNYKWLEENGVGPGSVVTIERSGDVIPNIAGVVVRKPIGPLPSKTVDGVDLLYEGGDSAVDAEIAFERMARVIQTAGIATIFNRRVLPKLALNLEDLFKSNMTPAQREALTAPRPLDTVLSMLVASGDAGRGVGLKTLQKIAEAPSFPAKTTLPGVACAMYNSNLPAIKAFLKLWNVK